MWVCAHLKSTIQKDNKHLIAHKQNDYLRDYAIEDTAINYSFLKSI